MLKHYVLFYFDGDDFNHPEQKEIPNRNESVPLDVPKGVYAYRFFDRNVETFVNGKTREGEKINFSPMFYVKEDGTVEKKEQK